MCRGCINCKGSFTSQCGCEIKSLGDTFVSIVRHFIKYTDVETSKNIYDSFSNNGKMTQFYDLSDEKYQGKYISFKILY